MKPFKAKLRGKSFTISPDRIAGNCDDPKTPGEKIIMVDPACRGREELRVIIHEALHACYWDLSEDAIHEGSRDVGELLWTMGYRISKK